MESNNSPFVFFQRQENKLWELIEWNEAKPNKQIQQCGMKWSVVWFVIVARSIWAASPISRGEQL